MSNYTLNSGSGVITCFPDPLSGRGIRSDETTLAYHPVLVHVTSGGESDRVDTLQGGGGVRSPEPALLETLSSPDHQNLCNFVKFKSQHFSISRLDKAYFIFINWLY